MVFRGFEWNKGKGFCGLTLCCDQMKLRDLLECIYVFVCAYKPGFLSCTGERNPRTCLD